MGMTAYFLSAAQLAQMRADVARMLPDTAIIQAVTLQNDGFGGATETWAAVANGTVACRVDPSTTLTQVQLAGVAEGFIQRYQLTMPHDAPLAVGNRVQIANIDYDVRQIDIAKSWEVSTRAVITKVAGT